jgi:hypothetical protein
MRMMRNVGNGGLPHMPPLSTAMDAKKRDEYIRVPDFAQVLVQPCKPAQRNVTSKSRHAHSRRIAYRAVRLSDDSRPFPDCDPTGYATTLCRSM